MKLVSTISFLILIAACPAFSLCDEDDQTAGGDGDYKIVNGFSGYLTLDDDPREMIRIWLDPEEIATLRAGLVMTRGKTMGAFVELKGCKQNARGMCNARVNYTIYGPHGSIFASRTVWQRAMLWKRQPTPAPHRSEPKRRNSPKKKKVPVEKVSKQSKGLAHMHFRLGKNDPIGEYKVKAHVTDLNADISFELERRFDLK